MRHILLTSKHWVKRELDGVYKVYNDIQEAIADGVPDSEIIRNWRSIKNNPEIITKIKNKQFPWVVSTDTFVPDHTLDNENRVLPLYDGNGQIIPTTGCVIEIIEYNNDVSTKLQSHYIRTCTGTFTFCTKQLTTEERKYRLQFTKFYHLWGQPDFISHRKREAAFALLSPMSPTHGRMVRSFIKWYPHYGRRHSEFVQRILALKFFTEPWFYKLIKKDWLMSILVKDLQSSLLQKGMDNKYIADKLELAMDLAVTNKDPKAVLAIVREIKDILQTETNPVVVGPMDHRLPPGSSPLELPATPFVDGTQEKPEEKEPVIPREEADFGGLEEEVDESKIIDATFTEEPTKENQHAST